MSNHPHQPCPYVACGSSDAFNYNDEGYGKCHSCDRSYPSRDEMFDWAKETYPVKEKQERTPKYWQVEPDHADFNKPRGIKESVAKLYGIQNQYDEDGELLRIAIKWPETVQYRKANDSQDGPKYSNKPGGGTFKNHLGGPEFNSGSSNRVYLTEGMFDAASLFQVLGETYPVRALPAASINKEFLTSRGNKNYNYLNGFKEIVYAGELDEPGRVAADLLYEAFPDKFFYVNMTEYKDANEFLQNGAGDTLKWAALKPQRYTPENFFTGDDAVETSIRTENPYEYSPTGHEKLDSMIRGLVKGGITFIKAPRGTGKTEIVRFFEYGQLENQDTTLALLHAEEPKSLTYRAFATYKLGVNVRTKDDAIDNGISEDQVIEAAKDAAQGDRTLIFEMRAHDNPMKILEYVRLAATVYGADYIFVDHIQRLAYLSSTGVDGATSTLTALGSQMAQLTKELNIGVIFISQVNDDGRTKYAAALEEEAIICIKLDRDTESEDPVEQNTTNFVIDKNRPFSKLGHAGSLFYDQDTTLLREEF